MKISLMAAASVAALSLAGLALAQESTDTLQSMPAQAQQGEQTSAGNTAYGGAPSTHSATGRSSTVGARNPNNCSPLPFCNPYIGGQ